MLSGTPYLTVGDVRLTEGNSGARTALITVSLSAASRKQVTVGFQTENGAASAGADYQATSGRLTFAPGEGAKTVAVPVFGDRFVEQDETFSVRLFAPERAKISDDRGVVTITDDEPRVGISDVVAAEGCGCTGPTPFAFAVTLSRAYDEAVVVGYATGDGTATVAGGDYAAASGTLTFAPGETSKTITVSAFGDTAAEPDEWFAVSLTSSLAGSLSVGRATGWILDDDGPAPENPGNPGGGCTPDNPYYPNCGSFTEPTYIDPYTGWPIPNQEPDYGAEF